MPNKIKGPKPPLAGPIQRPSVPQNEKIVFSFNFFQRNHPHCNANNREAIYFHALLARLKVVGGLTVKQFRTMHAMANAEVLRVHPIDWKHRSLTESGFKIPNRQDLDDAAWQFSLDQHENGRVHGFLIDTTFHVVWLDPDHNLYKGK